MADVDRQDAADPGSGQLGGARRLAHAVAASDLRGRDTFGPQQGVIEYLEGRTLRAWMTERERLEAEVGSFGLVSPSLAVELMLPVVRHSTSSGSSTW